MSQTCRKSIFHKNILSLSCVIFVGLSMPAMAQSPTSSIPSFVPASGWQIQQTPLAQVRGLENMNLPCMMASSFDNGYIVRLSGNQGKILAMAIDFRQNVFAQGRKYPAIVSLDGAYSKKLTATAFSQSTLIFNLREMDGFYSAVSSASKLELNVQDNPMVFTLGGISNALKQLEGCASGDKFTSKPVQQASIQPAQPSSWAKPSTSNAPRAPMASKSTQQKAQVWEAKAGDDMRTILESWATRADVKLDWQATNAGKVTDDIRVQGTFEEAVQSLMARNAAALGLDANLMGNTVAPKASMARQTSMSSNAPQSLLPSVSTPVSMGNSALTPMPNQGRNATLSSQPSVSSPTMSPSMGMTSGGASAGGQWSAPAGASLQQILKSWSSKANVELIWDSNQGFSVMRPIKMGGSYEEVLQSLLNQYTNLKIRPAAQLNNDPVTGRKTLFIQSSRVL